MRVSRRRQERVERAFRRGDEAGMKRAADRVTRRQHRQTARRATGTSSCALTAVTAGVSLIVAAATVRGWTR